VPGRSWDDARDEVADLMIDTVDRSRRTFARASSAGARSRRSISSGSSGSIGGDIFHGALALDQLFSARPVLGHGNYRSPIRGLYMCGSGTHPRRRRDGAPGHNAAREISRTCGGGSEAS
jgi:phytoene dehydrogenase-like protein